MLNIPKMCMPEKRQELVEAEVNLRLVSTASGTHLHISACAPFLGADPLSEACPESWFVYL